PVDGRLPVLPLDPRRLPAPARALGRRGRRVRPSAGADLEPAGARVPGASPRGDPPPRAGGLSVQSSAAPGSPIVPANRFGLKNAMSTAAATIVACEARTRLDDAVSAAVPRLRPDFVAGQRQRRRARCPPNGRTANTAAHP